MTTFVVARVARRPHKCTAQSAGGCTNWITPGERYVKASLAPGSDLGNDTWWHMIECGPCATYYGNGALLVPQETS